MNGYLGRKEGRFSFDACTFRDQDEYMPICSADTSPLIAFSGINRLDVLRAVFDEVWVPGMVFTEIVPQGVGWEEAAAVQQDLALGQWMRIMSVPQGPLLESFQQALGACGEAEAICLAATHRVPVLLDEIFGRKVAVKAGVQVIGSLGVLKVAKDRGVIPCVRSLISGMVHNGIRFHDNLISQFLIELGET